MKITLDIQDDPRRTALRNFCILAHIVKLVCREFGVSVAALESPERPWNYVWPRWCAFALIRRYTSFSLHDIGDLFGGKDHRGIIHALRRVEEQCETNAKDKARFDFLDAQAAEYVSTLNSGVWPLTKILA